MKDNNILIKGDNVKAMKWLLDNGFEGKIDLFYTDPPFATGGIFSKDKSGRVATISKSNDSQIAYSDTLQGKEFIEFLRERALLIHRLLSDKGSLYLHIDYKIGHYVKVMLDEVFGINNFRNDITRIKCNPKNFERIGYGNIKDMYNILKSSKELCGYAYLYKYYREFSQSEHFSMKGRYMNYKQEFHDKYYNKVLGFIHLGEKYIYEKYNN